MKLHSASRVYLITYKDPKTGATMVSHGVDEDTLRDIVLPQERLDTFPVKWDDQVGMYYLRQTS